MLRGRSKHHKEKPATRETPTPPDFPLLQSWILDFGSKNFSVSRFSPPTPFLLFPDPVMHIKKKNIGLPKTLFTGLGEEGEHCLSFANVSPISASPPTSPSLFPFPAILHSSLERTSLSPGSQEQSEMQAQLESFILSLLSLPLLPLFPKQRSQPRMLRPLEVVAASLPPLTDGPTPVAHVSSCQGN